MLPGDAEQSINEALMLSLELLNNFGIVGGRHAPPRRSWRQSLCPISVGACEIPLGRAAAAGPKPYNTLFPGSACRGPAR
jgi:hypothetical protein